MSKYFSLLSLIFIWISCGIKSNEEFKNRKNEDSVFSLAMENEILKMIEFKNDSTNDAVNRICNVIIIQNDKTNFDCHVITLLSSSMIRETKRFIPPDLSENHSNDTLPPITGYTFLQNELICCFLIQNSCYDILIDPEKLNPFNDSIQSFLNNRPYSNSQFSTYDTPITVREYKVVNADSLKPIESLFIP